MSLKMISKLTKYKILAANMLEKVWFINKNFVNLCGFESLWQILKFCKSFNIYICHQVTKTQRNIIFWLPSTGWIIVFCFFLSSSFAQNKYYIYFKDKGITSNQSLSKFSIEYQSALESLSERSIERRIKNMGEDNIITYEDLPINKNYVDAITSQGIKIENELRWFNAITVYLNEEQKSSLLQLPFVDKVEPVRVFKFKREEMIPANYLVKETSSQDQINYGSSFTQLNLSDIPQVHTKGITGDNIIIGILDSGFKWKGHESLVNANVIAEYDFIFKDTITANQPGDSPSQDNHGTSVFSVIGGYKDSVLIGVAFNSSFILAKTEDVPNETHLEEDNYAAALIWMDSLGVDITTSSLGYNIFDDSVFSYKYSDMNGKTTIVTKAAELAFQRGVVTLSAAGNEADDPWFHIIAPADGFNTLGVGAVTQNNNLANFSSRGPSSDGRIKPDIVAQGVGVFSASASGFNSYSLPNGTSMSTPIAAGVASLLLSAHPHLINSQVRNILMETADNSSSPNNERGYGLISAADAISFPNFQMVNDTYKLNKIFFSNTGVDVGSVKLNYSTNEKDFSLQNMTFDGTMKFVTEFPLLPNGQMVDFYFNYDDTLGNSVREPNGNTTYKFKYGDLNIYHNLSVPIPYDYGILSQNYPNPFNGKTMIKFMASSVEPAEITIIDASGQKVKTLFNGLAKKGENTIQWNGYTDLGISASSGVYVYILKIGGKEYGRKMVMLK
jgi:subtilisin family serine protease